MDEKYQAVERNGPLNVKSFKQSQKETGCLKATDQRTCDEKGMNENHDVRLNPYPMQANCEQITNPPPLEPGDSLNGGNPITEVSGSLPFMFVHPHTTLVKYENGSTVIVMEQPKSSF
eukprot:Em0006g187a